MRFLAKMMQDGFLYALFLIAIVVAFTKLMGVTARFYFSFGG